MKQSTRELLYEIYDYIREQKAATEHMRISDKQFDGETVKKLKLLWIEQFETLFLDDIAECLKEESK